MNLDKYQKNVFDWMAKCFQRKEALTLKQRAFRFLEEANELAQAAGVTREDAVRTVDYVYARPVGQIKQELGGVMVTACGVATAAGLSLATAGHLELRRCVENTEKIRAKDLRKPIQSATPFEDDTGEFQ